MAELGTASTENGEPADDAAGFAALCRRLCNWGRWGEGDELGTVNFITPQKVLDACAAVKSGEIVALGVPFDAHGPQRGGAGTRFNPIHLMTRLPTENIRAGGVATADDVVVLPLQAATQWDALAHVAHEGRIYGGRPASTVSSAGAAECDIASISGRILTRGVLLDIARHRGVGALEPGEPLEAEDLERCARAQRTEVCSGDAVLLRTGFLQHCRARDWEGYAAGPSPGLTAGALEWVHGHEVSALASDTTALEVKPSTLPGQTLPFHVVALVYMGLLVGEIFDLEALAARCAAAGRYEFLFVAPPLPVSGGVGAPINPYAVL